MRHQGRRSTSAIYVEPFGDLLLVCRVVLVHAAGGGLWAVINETFGCLLPNSAFSTDGVHCAPYFVQTVLELRVVATSQTAHRRLFFPSQLRFFSAVKLFSFHAIHPANSFMGHFHPLVSRLMVVFAES